MSENWLGLEKKVVVVTGGASGIGKHVVDTLVKAGAKTVVVDMNVETGAELDGAYCVQCNVTDPVSVQSMADAVVAKYGRIDALVNNAGINLPRLLVDTVGEKPQYELNEDSFNKMFAVNVKGVFLCAQACARQMLKQGRRRYRQHVLGIGEGRLAGPVGILRDQGRGGQLYPFVGQRAGQAQYPRALRVRRHHGGDRTADSGL